MTLLNCNSKARDGQFFHVRGSLYEQAVHIRKVFLQTEESPLMQVFKDLQISNDTKLQLKSALWRLKDPATGAETIRFQGNVYSGPLIQILSHPKIDDEIKTSLLRALERIIATGEPEEE
jgi:hypothetical protein